eukprot:TRINITY_DN4961_c0_g1_i1.p1 TRINITY_DN4961_c0_g1~~TRINITY_DN4961_c0_g1_i1.p1  ORF type:complete len:354 (-),score=76.07 TRINITY_DN4961_c0_g1_i1:34-1038(-)
MLTTLLGYIGAIVASVFFGSNYVPVKKYPTGDGMAFVYVFSNGVMVVGLIAMFINGEAIFVPTGLLGGSLWALGNLAVIPIVKTLGLGLGQLLWGGTSLLTGFLCGKFGLFGLAKDTVGNNAMNWGGIACIFCSMVVFFFIRPHLEDSQQEKDEYQPINVLTEHSEKTNQQSAEFFDRIPKQFRMIIGFSLALVSGMFYGVNMVPMKLWVQAQSTPPTTLAFVFSHFTGIYLFGTVVFFTYCIVKRPPQVFPSSILPSFISGAMWGIAQCGLMTATEILGFAVGFPIGSAGPSVIAALWGVFVFREIRGVRNLSLLVVSFLFSGAGIALLSKSR